MKTGIVALMTAAFAIGADALEVRPDQPVHADLETAASTALPAREIDSIRLVSVEIEAMSSPTNGFEVAFFASEAAHPETCRFLVGLDRGRLFARGLRLDSEAADNSILAEGAVRLSFSFAQHTSGRTGRYEASVNGVANVFLADQLSRLIPDAQPSQWRSVKVVSRGLADDMPSVRFEDHAKGLAIRICRR